jgi:hypothetical protein
MKKEPMDIRFAAFNCHVNNAKQKAIMRFVKKFGSVTYRREIKPILKNGIMSIFHKEPNEHTKYFAETIQEIVNS